MIFDKVFILFPKGNGGVKEVCRSLNIGFESKSIETEDVNSLWLAFKLALKSRFTSQKQLFITNLSFGVFGLFAKYSVFIIHGYPFYRTESYFGYRIKLFLHYLFAILNKKSVAVSFLTRYVCENHLGIRVSKVIQNPLPEGFLNPDVKQIPDTLVYLGRLVASKNIDIILSGVEMLRKSFPGRAIKFNIIGNGPMLDQLKSKFPHEDNIFHGYIDVVEKYKIMKASSAFISLCEGEPFGVTALEAKYLNLKCILPTYGGHQEFLPKQLLFPVNNVFDIEEVSGVINSALTSPFAIDGSLAETITKDLPGSVVDKYLNLFS
ncbi:glycosyltransferase [Pedobacter miscanthi]|uniref:Glycosyl transferase family 1 domain-containing protein n=1 Tax=Pedobacter miscanthi TaxID=2259170 RepID=A0A366KQJ7_9SPHI|nr:glycosyltransferase [Pedobacter miscanthi]RBQ03563.1 hypothetical protein DRW42_21390 [Pedobacter miscanthi]